MGNTILKLIKDFSTFYQKYKKKSGILYVLFKSAIIWQRKWWFRLGWYLWRTCSTEIWIFLWFLSPGLMLSSIRYQYWHQKLSQHQKVELIMNSTYFNLKPLLQYNKKKIIVNIRIHFFIFTDSIFTLFQLFLNF